MTRLHQCDFWKSHKPAEWSIWRRSEPRSELLIRLNNPFSVDPNGNQTDYNMIGINWPGFSIEPCVCPGRIITDYERIIAMQLAELHTCTSADAGDLSFSIHEQTSRIEHWNGTAVNGTLRYPHAFSGCQQREPLCYPIGRLLWSAVRLASCLWAGGGGDNQSWETQSTDKNRPSLISSI